MHYSGTMGVVVEGCLNGIPSIGFSLCNHDHDADFEATGLLCTQDICYDIGERTSSFNLFECELPEYCRYQRNKDL